MKHLEIKKDIITKIKSAETKDFVIKYYSFCENFRNVEVYEDTQTLLPSKSPGLPPPQ